MASVPTTEAGSRQNGKKVNTGGFSAGRDVKKKTKEEEEEVHHVLFSLRDQQIKRQRQHAGCFCTYGPAGWTHRRLINDLSGAKGKGEDLQPRPSGLLTQDSASATYSGY